jgi:transcriptional regulator with XRE-family HTH domain
MMGTAMDDFSQALRALMAEHGVGVRALARQVPCDHALVSRLSSGQRPPSAAMARRLDAILGADGRLAAAADPGPWSGRGELQPLSAPALVRAISRVTLGDLGKTGIPGGSRLPDPAARGSAALARWAAAAVDRTPARTAGLNRADRDELSELEKTAAAFRRWGHQYGGGMRRKAVVGQFNEMADLLAERHPRAVYRRLFGVAASLALVAGHMSADAGRDGLAHWYFALALDAAREAGDDDMGARVVNALARQLVADGRATAAIGLLQQARPALRRRSPASSALLAGCAAWALAFTGSYDSVARVLDQVTALAGDTPGHPLFGAPEIAGTAGACCEVLALRGHGPQSARCATLAAEHIATALGSREPFYVRSRVLDLLGLANVRLAQREPEEAVRTAALSLEQIATLRSSRARHRVHQFAVRALTRFPQSGQAREFAEKVRATVPAVPPGAGRPSGGPSHAVDGPRTPVHL